MGAGCPFLPQAHGALLPSGVLAPSIAPIRRAEQDRGYHELWSAATWRRFPRRGPLEFVVKSGAWSPHSRGGSRPQHHDEKVHDGLWSLLIFPCPETPSVFRPSTSSWRRRLRPQRALARLSRLHSGFPSMAAINALIWSQYAYRGRAMGTEKLPVVAARPIQRFGTPGDLRRLVHSRGKFGRGTRRTLTAS